MLRDAIRVVLFNTLRSTEWDKVMYYLSSKENYVTNEKVCLIIGNPDTAKVSRILRRWVDQGLLVKIDRGAKKTVSYRLPVDTKQGLLFAGSDANKTVMS
jgi:hypothetical protein